MNGQGNAVCGFVNAKNAYGAYTGDTLFYAFTDGSSSHLLTDTVDGLVAEGLSRAGAVDFMRIEIDLFRSVCGSAPTSP